MQALLRILLRLLGFELRPVSSFSSTTFALLIYHEDGHGAVGLGLFLGISALDVAPMVAHPVDDVAHLVGGQALKVLDRFCSEISRISSWMRSLTVFSGARSAWLKTALSLPGSAPFSLMALISLPMKSWHPASLPRMLPFWPLR